MDSVPTTVFSISNMKEDPFLSPSVMLPAAMAPEKPLAKLRKFRDDIRARIYRFEVTYGLYVMDFWEKAIVYGLLFFILAFAMWKMIIPLSAFGLRMIAKQLALEPKGFHSVLERNNIEYIDYFAGNNTATTNITSLTVYSTQCARV